MNNGRCYSICNEYWSTKRFVGIWRWLSGLNVTQIARVPLCGFQWLLERCAVTTGCNMIPGTVVVVQSATVKVASGSD